MKQEGDIQYRDRRLLALYFDLSGMPQPDQFRSFDAAQRFIQTRSDRRGYRRHSRV